MSIEILKQLRKKSQLILSPSDRGDLPIIQRSLDQLEREMKSMNDKIKPTQELHAKAHYFLASNGIDTEHVSNSINTSRTFEIAQMEDHTDIKKFLEEEHEKIVIDIIEKQRNVNHEDFEEFFENQFESFVTDKNRERMEEDENSTDLKEFEKYNNSTGITRIIEYANVVQSLNANRALDTDVDLITQFSSIRNLSDLKRSQDGAFESWGIMGHLVNKSGIEGRLEGRFLKDYTTQPYHSAAATNTRRSLITVSKSWLEQQSAQYINDVLNRNATKVQVGGIPSATHRLRAFIDLIFKTSNGWSDDKLEVVEGLPIWLFIYLIIRIGHLDTAAKFIDTHREMFATERKFVPYFEEYVSSAHHCVSKATQEAILADYQKFHYGEKAVDPYKVIIYKIIGRCELDKKSYPDIIKTTEDYIWLQLTLVREVTDTEKYAFERYRLQDVQKDISNLGSKYFDKDETNPWIYFKLLLLTHQFEEAIDHLYKQKKLRLETVHFALALVYSGLLKIPQPKKINTSSILIANAENAFTLNFPRLIYQYVQVYIPEKPKEALDYLCTLSLYSRNHGYPNDDMIHLARSYVCKFTMASKDFKTLLGTPENQRIPGLIDNQKKLLYIGSESDYAQHIIQPIAEKCVQTGRCMDAVYAYSLSGDYNKMVDVLAKELSDALQKPQSFRATDPALSELSNEEIIQSAITTMQDYEKNQYVSPLIDESRKSTVRILIQLLQFRVAYEQGRYESALQLINCVQVIPLGGDLEYIQLFANQFEGLAETIKKNIPELLLNVMDILYKIWASYLSNSVPVPNSELESLEQKARTVLTFTGLIQFSIPGDIIIRLNKADMLMSVARRR